MFDKNEFVESVIERGLSRNEIVSEALDEIRETESRLDLVIGAATNPVHSPTALIGTPANRAAGSGDDVRFLHSLVFFLQGRVIPENLSDDDFQILFRLTQYLVDRFDLEPDVLELFGE